MGLVEFIVLWEMGCMRIALVCPQKASIRPGVSHPQWDRNIEEEDLSSESKNTKGSPKIPESRKKLGIRAAPPNAGALERLVRALGKQSDQNHQVGKGKQPLIRLDACRFRSACDETEVTGLREIVDVLHADTRQAGNL